MYVIRVDNTNCELVGKKLDAEGILWASGDKPSEYLPYYVNDFGSILLSVEEKEVTYSRNKERIEYLLEEFPEVVISDGTSVHN